MKEYGGSLVPPKASGFALMPMNAVSPANMMRNISLASLPDGIRYDSPALALSASVRILQASRNSTPAFSDVNGTAMNMLVSSALSRR